jgi:multidrug efflux pump subunit AcrA (membrane-fusion protein)
MELRRKRGVERRILNCDKYFDKLFALFVHELGEEISPEQLNRICYDIINEKRNRGKWTKLKSVKRYLTKYRLIKYDFERDIYLNWRKIKHQEKERAEADQRKAEAEAQRIKDEAQRAEDERLRLERLEADRVQREAQRIRDEAQRAERERLKAEPQQAVAKPSQAHRETQSQQVGLPRFNLRQLKLLRDSAVRSVSEYEIKSEKETDQAKLEKCLQFVEVYKRLVSKYELEISELEKYEAKLSV